MKKRGRPRLNPIATHPTRVQIDFSQITKLSQLDIDSRMMDQMESG